MQTAASHLSPFSGSWYPDEPGELRQLIADLLAQSERRTGRYLAPRAAAFVVPHAGLIYSGTVAAAAYRHIRALSPDRVVLLGFAHRGTPKGAWLPDIASYQTVLGDVPIDREFSLRLTETGAFGFEREEILCDHSVEIQLPFIQAAAPGAPVVPVYVSRLDADGREAAAAHLASLLDPRTVLVASSDFTHYGRSFGYQPFPADNWVADRLRDMDERTIEAAGTLSASEFLGALRETGSTVCGYEPISLLLDTLRVLDRGEEIFQETLDYQTSGEITGDYRHSVSYAALGFFPYRAFELSPEDGRALVGSARRTLERYLETGERKPIPPETNRPALDRRAAAFVTLHSGGMLRGCVGRRATCDPLWQIVPQLALAAALEDTRFDPVRPGEGDLEIEISVLTPAKRILHLDDFRVNEHGAVLESGHSQGLLLPQVASERNWTAQQFLDALTRKAGAARDAYKHSSTRISVFRAQILR